MADKVQKIREEIKRKLNVMQYQLHRKDTYKELKSILDYIDSLQEKPVSEDLEEAADKMMSSKYCWSGDGETTLYTREQMKDYFKAGAEWGMTLAHGCPKELVSEDLEEAAKEHSFMDGADDIEEYARYDIKKYNSFKAGAKWQKEKMVAKAADAVIGVPYHNNRGGGYIHLVDVSKPLPVGNNKIAIIF